MLFVDLADYIIPEDKQLQKCEKYKLLWENLEDFNKRDAHKVLVCSSFSKAVFSLSDGDESDVLVTGSIHLVGAALSVIDPTLNGALVD